MRVCAHCSTAFTGRHRRDITCSEACRVERRASKKRIAEIKRMEGIRSNQQTLARERERKRQWERDNPEKVRTTRQKYRARVSGAPVVSTPRARAESLAQSALFEPKNRDEHYSGIGWIEAGTSGMSRRPNPNREAVAADVEAFLARGGKTLPAGPSQQLRCVPSAGGNEATKWVVAPPEAVFRKAKRG